MTKKSFGRIGGFLRRFLDVTVVVILALLYAFAFQSPVRIILGVLFFFLPGYSVTRFLFRQEKRDLTSAATYVLMISLSINPLLGNLVQIITVFTAPTILLVILLFSLPFLIVLDLKPKVKVPEKGETEEGKKPALKWLAFLGAALIGFGLYLLASWGAAAPRGYDIYGHMRVVVDMISTQKAIFRPDLDTLSNFYVFTYAEMSLLTGLKVLSTGLLLQTLLGGTLAIGVFYFAETVTGSSLAAFISAVLFIAGPPIYANASSYFYFFHPMWVAMALFPFVLAYTHKSLLEERSGITNLSPLFITALFLYHLTVGLMFFAIFVIDLILLLIIFKKKRLVINLGKSAILTFLVSSVIVVPFINNISNPFRFVYPEGGLQSLYRMFFGISAFAFYSPGGGWAFFSTYIQEFLVRAAPLLALGIPVMVYLFIRRKASFALMSASLLTGLLGIVQPWLGLAFLPQRFIQPLIMFGSTLVGFLISSVAVIPRFQLTKREKHIKIRIVLSRTKISRVALLLIMFCYIVGASYLMFYSPARQSVVDAELYLTHDDVFVMEWMDQNIPRNATILMDQYLQVFFCGITGRQPAFSITSGKAIYEIWDIYPVNVYIGQTDASKTGFDYVVISPWTYTTWHFVGKKYFDENQNLLEIFEHQKYAVYKVLK